MSEDFDLFGFPYVDKPKRRGRPKHIVTKKNRNRVNMLVAMGWSSPRIATTMEISLPTLHKYYFYELGGREAARDKLTLRRLELAWELSEKGNVGAFKEFGRLVEQNDRMEIESAMSARSPEAEAPSQRLGKKAIDAQRAVDADADLMAELEAEAAQNVTH